MPDEEQALMRRAFDLKKAQRFDEAVAALDRVLATMPHYATAIGQKAHLLHLLNRTEEGLRLLSDQRSQVEYPDYVLAVEAELLQHARRDDEARALVDRLYGNPSLSEPAARRIIDVLRHMDDLPRARQLAARLVKVSKDRQAALLLQAELEEDPGPVLRTLLQDYPDDDKVFEAVARLRLDRLPLEQAVEELETLLQTSRGADNVKLRKDYGLRLRRAARSEEALKQFERCLLQTPHDHSIRAQLGYCLADLGRHAEAVDALEECLQERPRDLFMRSALFSNYRKSGQIDRARTFVESMVARHGDAARPLWGELKRIQKPS